MSPMFGFFFFHFSFFFQSHIFIKNQNKLFSIRTKLLEKNLKIKLKKHKTLHSLSTVIMSE